MARRVSVDDIRRMNEIYYQCKSYAETARQTGWSASTVKNYIDVNFKPVIEENVVRFNVKTDLPEFSTEQFVGQENFGALCVLSEEEKEEIVLMWEELSV